MMSWTDGRHLSVDPVEGVQLREALAPGWSVSAGMGLSYDSRRARDVPEMGEYGRIGVKPAVTLTSGFDATPRASVRLRAAYRIAAAASAGSTMEVQGLYKIGAWHGLGVAAGLQATYMDGRYATTFFSPGNGTLGLGTRAVHAGWRDAGASLQSQWELVNGWRLGGRLGANCYSPLTRRSPVVHAACTPAISAALTRAL